MTDKVYNLIMAFIGTFGIVSVYLIIKGIGGDKVE